MVMGVGTHARRRWAHDWHSLPHHCIGDPMIYAPVQSFRPGHPFETGFR